MKTTMTSKKAAWGPGPWQDEPDQEKWVTAAGYPGIILRNVSIGHLCGYVAVPENHPWEGMSYSDEVCEVEVHCGLTFSGRPNELGIDDYDSGGRWWFGFDCAHSCDISPGMKVLTGGIEAFSGGAAYRDMAYVREQVEKLAQQLRAVAPQTLQPPQDTEPLLGREIRIPRTRRTE